MDLFRVGHDVYDQPVLEGVSWDLLPIALGVAVVVIVGHQVYRLIRGPGRGKRGAR